MLVLGSCGSPVRAAQSSACGARSRERSALTTSHRPCSPKPLGTGVHSLVRAGRTALAAAHPRGGCFVAAGRRPQLPRREVRMTLFNRQTLQAFVALGSLLVGVGRASAAQQGSVAGQVTDKSSQQPVSGAQVVVIGTSLQSRTSREGRYAITRVPAGRYDVQVRLIGYATATQQVTVGAGEAATLDISLSPAAVPLDVVVVTGTGAEQLSASSGIRSRPSMPPRPSSKRRPPTSPIS